MKLVMDLVVNHSSDEHPWFVSSRAGLVVRQPETGLVLVAARPRRAWNRRRARGRTDQLGLGLRRPGLGMGRDDPRAYYLHLFSKSSSPT